MAVIVKRFGQLINGLDCDLAPKNPECKILYNLSEFLSLSQSHTLTNICSLSLRKIISLTHPISNVSIQHSSSRSRIS